MTDIQVRLTEDEALVLFEYFERFDETDDLRFRHPAEYVALQRVAEQVVKGSPAAIRKDYDTLLSEARERVAAGFDGSVPCLKSDDES